jgi:putative restriction endonuclease
LLVKGYVGVTDGKWFRFLAGRPDVNEVNFWRPGGGSVFRVLSPGEPFFFKTHYPHNRVVGGGFYSGFAHLRVSEAWEFFGVANGAQSLDEMRLRVGKYRRTPIAPTEDPVIGCVFVRDVAFFAPGDSVEPPPRFAPNVVQGKSYDFADPSTRSYFEELLQMLLARSTTPDLAHGATWHRDGPTYAQRLTRQRLGQRSFQAVVLQAYERRCAITGAKIRPVLEAAHIRPLNAGGEHRLDNGLLLRSDIHTLFDRGYIGVDPKYRLVVSPRLREEFHNGDELYTRSGSPIAVPVRRADRPNAEFLDWHLDQIFIAH